MKPAHFPWPLLVLVAAAPPSWAGRPLATDDAGTADPGTCQVEGWVERSGGSAATWVVAPACALVPGLELGGDYTRLDPESGPASANAQAPRASGGLSLKWAPAAAQASTPLGPLSLGLRLDLSFDQPAGAAWRNTEAAVLALASLALGARWSVHANVGPAQDRPTGIQTTRLNLALVWAPQEALMLFVETQANDRPATQGGSINSLGGRWWLLPQRLGLDLVAARPAGAGHSARWNMGLGWYGLAW